MEEKPATEGNQKTSEVSFQEYLDNLRARTPSAGYRRQNAKKFIKAHARITEDNYGGRTPTIDRMKDRITMENYINGGPSSLAKTKMDEEWKKAVDAALKDAVKYEEKRATRNKKTLRWTIPTGVAAIGVPSFFIFGNKASTNNKAKDENQRIDVAGDNTQTITQTPAQPTINAFNAADSSNIEAMREEMKNFGY